MSARPFFTPDLVVRLRDLRKFRGLTQRQLGRLSGVGEKTISSFETGQRIESLKLSQLRAILGVFNLTEADFFAQSAEEIFGAISGGPQRDCAHWYANEIARIVHAAKSQGLDVRVILNTARDILSERRGMRGVA
jgi:transcriptional regulator with XRE-family HTH domain